MNLFQRFVSRSAEHGELVVQPRMGFSDPDVMRAGLLAVRDCAATAAGTITVDSYTRVNDHEAARRAVVRGRPLNGFPVVAYGSQRTAQLLDGVANPDFPVQVRHGSARPYELFRTLIDAGIEATEGGPVSYCLPYSRVPLRESTREWARCIELAAAAPRPLHVETFGGCMLGQLCPPGLLVALSVLEAMFFVEHGLRTLSLSYAQQTHPGQDVAGIRALRRLAAERLPGVDWHLVVYTYMGVYPQTELGAFRLLEESVQLAISGGAHRLVVKTSAEAHRIPTVEENVSALEFAAEVGASVTPEPASSDETDAIYAEASALIEETMTLAGSTGDALIAAFASGRLDVPYCLHRDNGNRSRAGIDPSGRLVWTHPGGMPVPVDQAPVPVDSTRLLDMLHHNRDHFDGAALSGRTRRLL